MIRISLLSLAVLLLLSSESRSRAEVTVSSSVIDTPGLPGFKTATVFANSTTQIWVIDFAGDGSNDPVTGKGFFGPLNQASGISPTVFDINPGGEPLPDLTHDSHFLVKDASGVREPRIAKEGPTALQAFFQATWLQSSHAPIAQLVIPSGATVAYRGTIFALSGRALGEFDVAGVIVAVPEPTTGLLTLAAVALLFTVRRRG